MYATVITVVIHHPMNNTTMPVVAIPYLIRYPIPRCTFPVTSRQTISPRKKRTDWKHPLDANEEEKTGVVDANAHLVAPNTRTLRRGSLSRAVLAHRHTNENAEGVMT